MIVSSKLISLAFISSWILLTSTKTLSLSDLFRITCEAERTRSAACWALILSLGFLLFNDHELSFRQVFLYPLGTNRYCGLMLLPQPGLFCTPSMLGKVCLLPFFLIGDNLMPMISLPTLHLTCTLHPLISLQVMHCCNLWCLMISYSVFTHRHFCSYFVLANFNVCYKYLQDNVTLKFDSLF